MRKLIHFPKIAFLFISIFLLTSLRADAQVSGVKTIPSDYASITEAVQQIRTVGVSGPTFLELQAGYNSAVETFPIKIREIPGTSATNSVTISPAAGATGISIISANSGAAIEFIGAYNIIIDGRPGRTGSARELTIRNSETTGKAISFFDGAVNNSVTWCKLEGSGNVSFPYNVSNGGVVFFGRSTEPIPDNILLENVDNTVSSCIVTGINSAATAINAIGTPSLQNAGNKIVGNEMLNFRSQTIYISQGAGTNWTITGNSIYEPVPDANAPENREIINFQPGAGSVNNTISGNFIGGQAAQAEGGQWILSVPSHTGISISAILIDAGSVVVENNIIQNFRLEPTDLNRTGFLGIAISRGAVQLRGNLIGGNTEAKGIMLNGRSNSFRGIISYSCSPVSIENNRMSNITMQGQYSSYFFGIQFRAGSGTVVTGNQIDQVTASSAGTISFTAISILSTIYSNTAECPASPQPSVIDHNLIDNITLSSDEDSASFTGIEIAGTGGPATQLHYNQVYKINVAAPGGIASFTGILMNERISGNTGNIIGSATEANSIMVTGKTANATAILVNESPDASISDDIIGNITVNGTLSATMKGIDILGGGKASVTGNQLKDLSVSSSGPADMIGISFDGAVTSSEPSTLHNNKVYKVNVSSSDGVSVFTGVKIKAERISGNTGNIIGSATEANSIIVTGKSASANGIHLNNSNNVSVSSDIIANITANGTLDPGSVNGIFFEGGLLVKIDSNNIHDLTAPVARGVFIQTFNSSSTVTLEKNIIAGLNTANSKGIETSVTSEGALNLTATDNTINNWQTGVLLAAASGATLQLSFQNNSVVANQTGFINNNSAPVNATCNWWGDASGPSGAGPGTGNPVGPNVIFSPWATLSTYVAVNAGADQTITGSGSKTLSPTYTVCGTAAYLWSTGATTPSITVSPTVTTVYSIKITDASGHEAIDEVTVFVESISLPKISIVSTVVTEGNNGTNNAVFILVLSKTSTVPVTVKYQTSNNTATAPQDYTQKNGTVTFPANSLVGLIQTVTIQVKGDLIAETDETFKVLLSNAVNATINYSTATCTVVDNDPPCLRMSDVTATENNQQAVITVSLTTASSKTVKVKYDTKDGTAKAPGDYNKVSNGTLTFQPGETTKSINIVIKKDAVNNESTEKFQVILKEPENATLTTTSYCSAKKDASVSIINSGSQQNRGISPAIPLSGQEENPGIIVPGLLKRNSQLSIRGLKDLDISLMIFDTRGVLVAKLLHYKNMWSPGNLASGIYFYQLSVRTREGKFEMHRGKIFITD